MKKLITLFAIATMLGLGLAGCKKDNTEPAPTPKPEEPAKTDPAAKTDTPPVVDPAAKTDPAATPSTGLAECDAYLALVEKYVTVCDKVAQETRDAQKKSIDAMRAGWANVGTWPADQKAKANEGCKASADGLKAGATQQGCTL